MSSTDWRPEYSVGNQALDDQHRVILTLCARIRNLSRSDPDYFDKLHIALHDMSVYASRHFRDEEKLLDEIDYPEADSQRQEHDHYQEMLTELLVDAVEGTPDADKMARFLEEWWVDHILNSDMKYKPCLSQSAR